jgi:DNA polymerase III subunit chi
MGLRVEFHTGVVDDLLFTCRLLRKACHQGVRVLVRAPAPQLARLDRELWTFVEREFLPHLRFRAPGTMPAHAARTPVWLVEGDVPAGAPRVLVNVGEDLPASLQAFDRIIEVVSADPDAALRGRARWRAYRELGLEVKHHAAPAAAARPDHDS